MRDPHADLFASPAALEALRRQWIAPTAGRAAIDTASDGFKVDLDLGQVRFPARSRHGTDVGLAAHEIGHFLTIDDKRCVRDAFDLRFGVPDLTMLWNPDKVATGTGQAMAEARAIAWETVLLEDLLQIDRTTHIRYQCWVLRHLPGFAAIPGQDSQARIDWLTDRTLGLAAELDSGAVEDRWRERIAALPRLFQREQDRLIAIEQVGYLAESLDAPPGWTATVYRHAFGSAEAFVVEICDPDGHGHCDDFDSMTQAKAFIEPALQAIASEIRPAP